MERISTCLVCGHEAVVVAETTVECSGCRENMERVTELQESIDWMVARDYS